MGMDMYIDAVKRDPNDKMNILERKEMCYWRKFWDLHYELDYGESMYGKDLKLTKDDIEKMLQFAIHNRDYFDGFKSVESLCEVLDRYDEIKKEGYDLVYNANW